MDNTEEPKKNRWQIIDIDKDIYVFICKKCGRDLTSDGYVESGGKIGLMLLCTHCGRRILLFGLYKKYTI